MKRITKRSSIIAAVTAVTLVAGGGVAFAYWTSSGSGSATADVASSAGNLTVTQDVAAPIAGLYPGGPGQDVNVIVDNPTTTDIRLSDVAMTVSSTSDAACSPLDFTIDDNIAYTGELVPAGGSTGSIAPKTIRLRETGANQDACKGVAVTLSLTAS